MNAEGGGLVFPPDLEFVYLWVDGVYVNTGLEKEQAAVLVVLAALRLRTDAAKRFKRVENATAVICEIRYSVHADFSRNALR